MKYIVTDESTPFQRELEQIFNLFKEDGDELVYSSEQSDGAIINFSYETSGILIKAHATLCIEGKEHLFHHELSKTESEKNNQKLLKKAISYVWLKVLEYVTGKKHDWGILTGVRPTKLYHKMLREYNYDHNQVKDLFQKNYLVSMEKSNLLKEITETQLKVIPDLYRINDEVSLYIGIPFCPTKCAYCTFPAYAIHQKGSGVEEFLEALLYEISEVGKWLKETNTRITTIYFGGGTPTSISAEQMDDLFEELEKWIDLTTLREITVEAGRPDTITEDKLNVLTKWKVNRISINPQTFSQETLDVIGRHHTVAETIEKYKLAREHGMTNINMDLIIGLPGETLSNLKNSFEQIEELRPESLTVHTMAFKRSSYLTKNRQEFQITEQEEVSRMMDYATKWTREQGYLPYYLYRQKNMLGNLENVGYAAIGNESLYNILIMEEAQTIIGLGSGAVSKLVSPRTNEIIRLPNAKEPKAYIQRIKNAAKQRTEKLNQLFLMNP